MISTLTIIRAINNIEFCKQNNGDIGHHLSHRKTSFIKHPKIERTFNKPKEPINNTGTDEKDNSLLTHLYFLFKKTY